MTRNFIRFTVIMVCACCWSCKPGESGGDNVPAAVPDEPIVEEEQSATETVEPEASAEPTATPTATPESGVEADSFGAVSPGQLVIFAANSMRSTGQSEQAFGLDNNIPTAELGPVAIGTLAVGSELWLQSDGDSSSGDGSSDGGGSDGGGRQRWGGTGRR